MKCLGNVMQMVLLFLVRWHFDQVWTYSIQFQLQHKFLLGRPVSSSVKLDFVTSSFLLQSSTPLEAGVPHLLGLRCQCCPSGGKILPWGAASSSWLHRWWGRWPTGWWGCLLTVWFVDPRGRILTLDCYVGGKQDMLWFFVQTSLMQTQSPGWRS